MRAHGGLKSDRKGSCLTVGYFYLLLKWPDFRALGCCVSYFDKQNYLVGIRSRAFDCASRNFIISCATPLTAIGMLYEPIANYFDKLINLFWFKIFPEKKKHKDEENALKELIRSRYLGGLGQDISNPYHLCKEYVETKQLSTTFMVFLSRYGFYRNASFLALASTALSLYHLGFNLAGIGFAVLFLGLAAVMKRRAEDFYSYLAPCVYRCYLIDKDLTEKTIET